MIMVNARTPQTPETEIWITILRKHRIIFQRLNPSPAAVLTIHKHDNCQNKAAKESDESLGTTALTPSSPLSAANITKLAATWQSVAGQLEPGRKSTVAANNCSHAPPR